MEEHKNKKVWRSFLSLGVTSLPREALLVFLYKGTAEKDAHEVGDILVLSHICMHRQSRDMFVVRMALHQHHRELLYICYARVSTSSRKPTKFSF